MKSFSSVRGKAIPYLLDDLDTDQIAPANMMRTLTPDYKQAMFGNRRRSAIEQGAPLPFDLPQYADAPILVTGANFGCGSARETAVWALVENGISCIVARGYSIVYRESCLKNGVLPIVLTADAHDQFARICRDDSGLGFFGADLMQQTLSCPDGTRFQFAFDETERRALLEGVDDVAATLRYIADIEAWEQRCARLAPWLQRNPMV